MVLQLTPEQLSRLTPHEGGQVPNYTNVIFLEDATQTNSPVTMQAGRRGSKRWSAVMSGDSWYSSYTGSSNGRVNRVALLNTRVSEGDRVILTSSEWGGVEAVVVDGTPNAAGRIVVDPDPSYLGRLNVGSWVKTREGAASVPTREWTTAEKELSEFWIERIKTAARTAKRKHGYCDQIDKLVSELLEPVLAKWTVKAVVTDPCNKGFDVLDPAGKKFAWFADVTDANKLVTEKNKKEFKL